MAHEFEIAFEFVSGVFRGGRHDQIAVQHFHFSGGSEGAHHSGPDISVRADEAEVFAEIFVSAEEGPVSIIFRHGVIIGEVFDFQFEKILEGLSDVGAKSPAVEIVAKIFMNEESGEGVFFVFDDPVIIGIGQIMHFDAEFKDIIFEEPFVGFRVVLPAVV